jgi:SAM-dependent methyltransferase
MSTAEFYDVLAPFYHLIYENWESSIERQSAALDSVIHSCRDGPGRSILDVACGIGTQSLGLASRGYEVVGSDISPRAIERARSEAAQRGVAISFSVSDMRVAHAHHAREFDVVLCADNSLPHLLTDEEISASLREFFACTKPGGLCILSVRDYASLERGGVQVKHCGVREDGRTRYVLFQVWVWRSSWYDVTFYIVHDLGGSECHTVVARSTYYAISISDLIRLMEKAGFGGVRRIDNEFFQPLIVGVRANERPGR